MTTVSEHYSKRKGISKLKTQYSGSAAICSEDEKSGTLLGVEEWAIGGGVCRPASGLDVPAEASHLRCCLALQSGTGEALVPLWSSEDRP